VQPGKCLINDYCFNAGRTHPAGCAECDPSVSQTSWVAIPGCYNIILAALNEGHDGNLGGIDVADCLCAKQAAEAGEPGIWKAFLSNSSRDVRDLIPPHHASGIWVTNLYGWWLYSNWTDIFEQDGWAVGTFLYNSARQSVDVWHQPDPEWYEARAWHGSYPDGTFKSGCDCQD
jgi:hypothetical protein